MAAGSPTMRMRQLGAELRRLREAAGKSQEEAGEWLGIPSTSISKMENAKQKVSSAYLRLLLQLYEVGSPHADALVQLRSESTQRGWWATYGKTVPDWFRDYVGMETVAAEVWTYEQEYIPGLLQISEYSKAIATLDPSLGEGEIQRRIDLRADRQQRLRAGDPVTLRAVVSEGALRREVGGREVMRAQLDHLAEVSKLPNVTFRVLPFAAGAHRAMRAPFTTLRFPDEPMNTVYLELYGSALYLESPDEIDMFAEIFERLISQSLNEEDTASMVAGIGK